MLDKSTVHANDVMVAQFVFLFLACSIFRETSTEMDVETVGYGKKNSLRNSGHFTTPALVSPRNDV